MLLLQFFGDLFACLFDRYALALQSQGAGANSGNQLALRRYQRAIAGSAVVRQNMLGIQARDLIQNCKPAARRPPIAIDIRHSPVLHDIA